MSLKDIIFPEKCVFCKKLTRKDERCVCRECMSELTFLSGSAAETDGEFFDSCVSALPYSGNVRAAVLRYKFHGKRNYAAPFAAFMAQAVRARLSKAPDVITWTPLSTKRRLTRGYDQAKLLAEELAMQLGVEAVRLLKKTSNNKAQSSLSSASQRRANVLGAYKACGHVEGKRILLVDDVVTTASTLGEASRMLLMAGAESVDCITFAKTQRK